MKMAVGAAVFADSESVAAMVLHTGEAAEGSRRNSGTGAASEDLFEQLIEFLLLRPGEAFQALAESVR